MKKHTYLRLFRLVAALVSMAVAQSSFFSGSKFIFSSHMAGHVILPLITAPFFVLAMRERPEASYGLAIRPLPLAFRHALAELDPWVSGILWFCAGTDHYQRPDDLGHSRLPPASPSPFLPPFRQSPPRRHPVLLAAGGTLQGPSSVRSRILALSDFCLGRRHLAYLSHRVCQPGALCRGGDTYFPSGSAACGSHPLDSRLPHLPGAAPSSSCGNGWAASCGSIMNSIGATSAVASGRPTAMNRSRTGTDEFVLGAGLLFLTIRHNRSDRDLPSDCDRLLPTPSDLP